MKSIQVFQLSMEDLSLVIRDAVKTELQKNNEVIQLSPKKDSEELLTRSETAKLLNVSLTTLFLWNRDGVLRNRKIRSRVFYLRSDVMNRLNVA